MIAPFSVMMNHGEWSFILVKDKGREKEIALLKFK